MFESAQSVGHVQKKVAEKVPGRDLETAEDLRDVQLFPEGQFRPADNFYLDGHQDASPKNSNTTAVTTTLATEMGKSPFQPRLMSWS